MKKLVTILTALTLALGMTACAEKDDSSILKVGDVTTTATANTSGTDNTSAETEQFGKDGDITGYGSGYIVCYENENGELISTTSERITQPFNINEGLDLVVGFTPQPDKNETGSKWIEAGIFKENGINADIYVFCNGQVIKHSLDPNEEATEKTTIAVTPNIQTDTHIYIPPTQLGNIESGLLWVCIDEIPEYIPESPRGELAMKSMLPTTISSSGEEIASSAYEAQENDYIYGEYPRGQLDPAKREEIDGKFLAVDIGKYDESCHSSSKNFMDDVAVIDKDTDFAVTAYFENDFDYYLAVFCDGELINAFDGKPLMKVNCQGGKRMIKYSLDKESLPGNGDHAYSVIAMPECPMEVINGKDVKTSAESNRRLIKIDI